MDTTGHGTRKIAPRRLPRRAPAFVLIALLASLAAVPAAGATAFMPTAVPGIGEVTAPAPDQTSQMHVPLRLTHASTKVVQVPWSTLYVAGLVSNESGPQAPPSDYTASSGIVTIPPGETTGYATFTVTGDTKNNFEWVLVTFKKATNANVGGTWGLGEGLIDPPGVDPTPTVGTDSLLHVYVDKVFPVDLSVPVRLNHPSTHTVTVDWTTTSFATIGFRGWSACEATDYTHASGTLTFPPQTVTATVSFHVNSLGAPCGFATYPAVMIVLSNPLGAVLDPSQTGSLYVLTEITCCSH